MTAFGIALPVFGLVGLGFLAGWARVMGPHAVRELNSFVVWLALPALLFDVMANAHLTQIWQPGFFACFTASALICFGLMLAAGLRRGEPLADAVIDALSAGYANVGYMGFPITLAVLGQDAAILTTIAALTTVCIVFALAIVLLEASRQDQRSIFGQVSGLFRTLVRNPLLVAPALGALFAATQLGIPAPAEVFLKMLGQAASPCALVCLGLFLANKAPAESVPLGHSITLTACKLVLQPAIAAGLAWLVFDLPSPQAQAAILLAALPTGTGPFMLAELYGRAGAAAARVVVLSTLGSIVTLSGLIAIMR